MPCPAVKCRRNDDHVTQPREVASQSAVRPPRRATPRVDLALPARRCAPARAPGARSSGGDRSSREGRAAARSAAAFFRTAGALCSRESLSLSLRSASCAGASRSRSCLGLACATRASRALPCAQRSSGWNEKETIASREDCLYLDVWAPEWPARSPKPVMLWLHGGGNTGGAGGSDPLYEGTRIVKRDVVLVIVDYRLGVFGFFGTP